MLYRCNGEPTFAWFETVPTLEMLLHHPFLLKALATWQVSFERCTAVHATFVFGSYIVTHVALDSSSPTHSMGSIP